MLLFVLFFADLLKAVHIIGKNSNNCFTPLQKLSDLAVSNKDNCCDEADDTSNHVCTKTIQSHPAFGFKASLIRLIGNLVHRNEKNQNFVSIFNLFEIKKHIE